MQGAEGSLWGRVTGGSKNRNLFSRVWLREQPTEAVAWRGTACRGFFLRVVTQHVMVHFEGHDTVEMGGGQRGSLAPGASLEHSAV